VAGGFPAVRPRRLRRTAALRRLVAQTSVRGTDLVLPLFVKEGIPEPVPVASMPGVVQHTRDSLRKAAAGAAEAGVGGLILFGIPAVKDGRGSAADDQNGIIQAALRDVAAEVGDDVVIMADLCLCEYTDHGHCGVLTPSGTVDNDATLERYGAIAAAQAAAGAHVVAPSGMMDGQVRAIRAALDGGGYTDRLGKSGISKLQAWVRNGGTIVAIKGASGFLRDKDVEISKLKPWEPPKKKDDDKTPAEERYNDYRIPGATFRTTMNDRSFLTFGVTRSPYVLIEGAREGALQPVAHRVDNIVTITKDNPLVSGVAWPESIDRIKGAVYMVSEPYGRGQVITFADEPHFRLFWRGTLPLFMNAVLYSPSFPRE